MESAIIQSTNVLTGGNVLRSVPDINPKEMSEMLVEATRGMTALSEKRKEIGLMAVSTLLKIIEKSKVLHAELGKSYVEEDMKAICDLALTISSTNTGSCYDKPQEREGELHRKLHEDVETFKELINKIGNNVPSNKAPVIDSRKGFPAIAMDFVDAAIAIIKEPRISEECHKQEMDLQEKRHVGILNELAANFFTRSGGPEAMRGPFRDHKDHVVLIKACFTQMERAKETAEKELERRKYGNTYPWCDVRRDHHVVEVEHEEGKSLLRFLHLNGGVEERTKEVAARLRATANEMDPQEGEAGLAAVIKERDEFKKLLADITLEVGKEFSLTTDFSKPHEQSATHVSAALFNHKRMIDMLKQQREQAVAEVKSITERLDNVTIVGPGWIEETNVTLGPDHATAVVEMGFSDTVTKLTDKVAVLEKENKRIIKQKSLGGWIAGEEHDKVVAEVALLKQTYNQLFDGYKVLEKEHEELKAKLPKTEG